MEVVGPSNEDGGTTSWNRAEGLEGSYMAGAHHPDLHMPPNLDDLDEEEQAHEVFAWTGLALYYAQVFEQGVTNLLLIAWLADRTIKEEFSSADAFFEAHGKLMLGRLLRKLENHLQLSDEVSAVCLDSLQRRNFLVHRYFVDRVELLFNQEGCRLVLDELYSHISTFRKADLELEDLLTSLGRRMGYTHERVQVELEKLIAKASAGEDVPRDGSALVPED